MQSTATKEITATTNDELEVKGRAARRAARKLATISAEVKNAALHNVADELKAREEEILAANEKDVANGRERGLEEYFLDRLLLNPERLEGLANDVRGIAALPDPIGEVIDQRNMPNGLTVGKRRVPLGVIGAIYESRPNVTIDISSLCLKSGNTIILRGGSDAINSNTALAALVKDAIADAGIPEDAVQVMETTDRAVVGQMLKAKGIIDLLIPRGSQALINRVASEATIPAITGGVGRVPHICGQAGGPGNGAGYCEQREGVAPVCVQFAGHGDCAFGVGIGVSCLRWRGGGRMQGWRCAAIRGR